MAASSSKPTCLLSVDNDSETQGWAKLFKEWIGDAGFEVRDYSAEAVANAKSLVAFPRNSEKILYQVAFGMGRGLHVLLVIEDDPDPTTYEPPPTKTVQIYQGRPKSASDAEADIKQALKEIALLTSSGTPRYPTQFPGSNNLTVEQTPLMLTTIDQAEQQFETFVSDGMSQESIRRMLTEAGARQSWLDFRIRRQFGGW